MKLYFGNKLSVPNQKCHPDWSAAEWRDLQFNGLVLKMFFLVPAENQGVPHIPDFVWSSVGFPDLMRLSIKKGAHAAL
jgi:hypothetical protein